MQSPSTTVILPFLVDTGASCNLLSSSTWKKIGTPTLQKDETRPLISASNDVIPTSGSVDLDVTVTTEDGDANSQILPFTVTDQLDILGTNAINSLQLTIRNNPVKVHVDNIRTIRSHQHLQESCLQICKEFPDLWKPELGCLKDYSLEVKFKLDVTPLFCKPRTVPFAVQEDLNQAYDVGIARGIWKPVTFNEYGTPVVPVRKQSQSSQPSGAVRVCGDYSVFINGQLEMHRQPMPLPRRQTTLLEEDFAHFGYLHTSVSDNATTFSSAEFQLWCHQRGIKHLTGAPYNPATNGAADRMVQSFKQSLKKFKLPPRPALQEFLTKYRRTPLNTGFSPSQLLNGRQLRTKIDALLPSPAHIAQEHQAREATMSQQKEQTAVQHVRTAYDVGTPCYALYCGPVKLVHQDGF